VVAGAGALGARSSTAGEGVARFADQGEQSAHRQLGPAGRGDRTAEHARGRRGHGGGDLLGGELVQLSALFHLVALGLEPPGDSALLHRHAELRHAHFGDHDARSYTVARTAWTMRSGLGT
jgi:hypothetical protein